MGVVERMDVGADAGNLELTDESRILGNRQVEREQRVDLPERHDEGAVADEARTEYLLLLAEACYRTDDVQRSDAVVGQDVQIVVAEPLLERRIALPAIGHDTQVTVVLAELKARAGPAVDDTGRAIGRRAGADLDLVDRRLLALTVRGEPPVTAELAQIEVLVARKDLPRVVDDLERIGVESVAIDARDRCEREWHRHVRDRDVRTIAQAGVGEFFARFGARRGRQELAQIEPGNEAIDALPNLRPNARSGIAFFERVAQSLPQVQQIGVAPDRGRDDGGPVRDDVNTIVDAPDREPIAFDLEPAVDDRVRWVCDIDEQELGDRFPWHRRDEALRLWPEEVATR